MPRLIFDIEADGLLDTVSKCWCICTLDLDSMEEKAYYNDTLSDGLRALWGADLLIGHNVLGYDIPALLGLYRKPERVPRVLDTLVTSRFLQPERPWGHSLEDWGKHLGIYKGDYNDWSKFTPEMLEYCKQDVRVNHEILKALEKENGEEFTGFSIYDSTGT